MTDRTRNIATTTAVNAGLLLIMAATAMPLLGFGVAEGSGVPLFGLIYAAGALAVLIGRLLRRKPSGLTLRAERLMRMDVWAALIFVVGAVLIFTMRGNDWIAFTLAGAVLTAYSAVMLGRNEKKQ